MVGMGGTVSVNRIVENHTSEGELKKSALVYVQETRRPILTSIGNGICFEEFVSNWADLGLFVCICPSRALILFAMIGREGFV